MPFRDDRLTVHRVNDREWELTLPLVYDGRDDRIVVPVGFRTDFASVPRSLQWLAPSTGKYTLAAILHDFLCGRTREGVAHGVGFSIRSRDVDGLFRRVMREEGVGPVQRWLLWSGVRIGAIRNRHRRPGTLRDVPTLLAGAIVCAPFILPPLVLIGLARFVYAVAEGLAGWFAEPFYAEETP